LDQTTSSCLSGYPVGLGAQGILLKDQIIAVLNLIFVFPNISSNKLKLSLKTSPSFDLVYVRDNTPVLNTTILLLRSSNIYQPSAFVELLGFGLVGTNSTAVMCEIGTDLANSTFDIIFGYFGDSFLYYDPGTYSLVYLFLHTLSCSYINSIVVACWTKSRKRRRRRYRNDHSCFSSNTCCILCRIHGHPCYTGANRGQLCANKVEKRQYGQLYYWGFASTRC